MYIAIEGIEGCGKSTLITGLRKQLPDAVYVREPGGTQIAEKIRDVIKSDHGTESLWPITELLLFTAARTQLLSEVVKPQIEAGKVVISDRSFYSTLAYQGAGNGDVNGAVVLTETFVMPLACPTIVIFLDIDYDTSQQRITARGNLDHIEKRDPGFFNRAREHFLQLASTRPYFWVIDASRSPEVILEDVMGRLQATGKL